MYFGSTKIFSDPKDRIRIKRTNRDTFFFSLFFFFLFFFRSSISLLFPNISNNHSVAATLCSRSWHLIPGCQKFPSIRNHRSLTRFYVLIPASYRKNYRVNWKTRCVRTTCWTTRLHRRLYLHNSRQTRGTKFYTPSSSSFPSPPQVGEKSMESFVSAGLHCVSSKPIISMVLACV